MSRKGRRPTSPPEKRRRTCRECRTSYPLLEYPPSGWRIKYPYQMTNMLQWTCARCRRARLEAHRAIGRPSRTSLYRFAHGLCSYCDCPLSEASRPWHADHVLPRQYGGGDHAGNLVASCDHCNNYLLRPLPEMARWAQHDPAAWKNIGYYTELEEPARAANLIKGLTFWERRRFVQRYHYGAHADFHGPQHAPIAVRIAHLCAESLGTP